MESGTPAPQNIPALGECPAGENQHGKQAEELDRIIHFLGFVEIEQHGGKERIENRRHSGESAQTRRTIAEDKNEIRDLCESLGISYQSFGDVFPDLDTGTCIMKDYLGRVSRVHIIQQNARWVHSFETNPMKKRMQMEQMESGDQNE